MHQRLEE
ncbi:hypothetical protein ACHAWX_000043 [Stephanocyclus meneghinianus]